MTESGYFLPMETVAAVMTFTLSWAVGAGVALLARALALRAKRRAGGAGGADASMDAPPVPESGTMRFFSWFLFLSPAAPVAAFVTLFEAEAAGAFLSGRASGPDANPLTGVLVWPAFLFVGLAILAAALLLCRRLRRRLGGENAGMYGLVLFAGLALAGLARLAWPS